MFIYKLYIYIILNSVIMDTIKYVKLILNIYIYLNYRQSLSEITAF